MRSERASTLPASEVFSKRELRVSIKKREIVDVHVKTYGSEAERILRVEFDTKPTCRLCRVQDDNRPFGKGE